MHKKWSLLLRISSLNVTKSAGNSGYGHIYWENFILYAVSRKQVVIRVIEKKKWDKRFIEKWRPISLLTVDCKLSKLAESKDRFFKKTRLFTQKISIVFWTNDRFTINLFSYVKNMQLFRHSPPCWHACQHHNLRKRLRISAFTAATRLGLGSSLLMAGSLLSLSIISMFLFDCWISLSWRGIICCNGRLIHCVLLELIQ